MQITDVKVRKLFEDGPMKAIVSVTFDGQLAVHDIKVINARDKFFIVMPSRKNPDETFRDIVHPINSQFRGVLEKAVIEAYNQALADAAAEDDRKRPLAQRMAHDLDKQPCDGAHARRRQRDEQPPCARKARPRRAVVVHAREL